MDEIDYFQGLVESAPDAMVVVDRDGLICLVNRQTEVMFGYSRHELVGEPIELLVPERHRGVHPSHRKGYFSEPRMRPMGASLELAARRKDRSEFPVDISLSPLETDQGLVVSAVIRDVTERQKADAELQRANAQLAASVEELERRNHEITLANEMSDLLQSCHTEQELTEIIERFAPRLFPSQPGTLFLRSTEDDLFGLAARWGEAPEPVERTFGAADCWALRRGKSHVMRADEGPHCPHLPARPSHGAMCVPMTAQGETLGLFHVGIGADPDGGLLVADQHLATTIAEQLSLALANFRLRETLRRQSIRDELTGLFNRRYMEVSLDRELQRADRHHQSLAVVLFDIDHFKAVNDVAGHAAGDRLLRELGGLLDTHVRGGDIACRYGGEEFLLVLPECEEGHAEQRAEEVCAAVRALPRSPADADAGADSVPPLTMSAGVAVFPRHGADAERLLMVADAMLYSAKAAGRDRVVTAGRDQQASSDNLVLARLDAPASR